MKLMIFRKTFPYLHYDKTNRPSPFSVNRRNVKVSQTFSQMWCLLRLFPLHFVNFFNKESKQWQLLSLFLDVLDVVLCPIQNGNSVANMKVAIEDFLEAYSDLYGPDSLTPKFHYLD